MKGTVLVVDDQLQNRLLAEAQLLAEGYEVHLAESGAQCLELVDRQPIDLVLLDVMMPEMDGFETCRRIRAKGARGALPVLFLTASHESTVQERAVASGADDFLQKPINRSELLMRVRSLIRVARLQRQRDQLIDLLVHDLKSPLSSIVSNAEFATEGAEGPSRDALADVLSAAERMQRMILELLDIGRAEDGKLSATLADVSLESVLRRIERDSKRSLDLRRQRLLLEIAAMTVRADETLLSRILQNLVENAMRYAPREGAISVDTAVNGQRARIRVRDEGPGIPEADRLRIFEKYGQVDAPRASRGSRGLGLFFCRLAAEAQGGQIWVEPNEPRGSVFILELEARA